MILGQKWCHLPGSQPNLTWRKKKHLKHHRNPPGWAFYFGFVLFSFTCLYEGVRSPTAVAQERWSSPPPPSAAPARRRWPAGMQGWPRSSGTSPADACPPSRKTVSHDEQRTYPAVRGELWRTHLLSLDSNKRLTMRLATVCIGQTMTRGNKLAKVKSDGCRPRLTRVLMEECVLPCSSSEAAFLLLRVDYKCKDKRYEMVQSQESLGFPE